MFGIFNGYVFPHGICNAAGHLPLLRGVGIINIVIGFLWLQGRKARLKPNSSASATQPRRGRAAVPASRTGNDNAVSHNRPSSRPPVRAAPQESQRSALEVNGTSATTAGSPEADKVIFLFYSLLRPALVET